MTTTELTQYDEVASDSDLIQSYLSDCRLRGHSPDTITSNRSNLRITASYMDQQGFSLLEVDKDALKALLDYLKNVRRVTHKTVESYFTTLSGFYEYHVYEEKITSNPVPPFRKRYLTTYKKRQVSRTRKLISVEEMTLLINSTLEIRDRALMTVLAKTGVRRGELISMDVDDVIWVEQKIRLKRKSKRCNLFVFFDDETAILLGRWLNLRQNYAKSGVIALFVGAHGHRIGRNTVYNLVTKHAEHVGIHDSKSSRLEDHFGPHCFRHWFTTHLRRNGMDREFIKKLRGDSRGETIDIYDHIDPGELRKAYLAAIPRLGIT